MIYALLIELINVIVYSKSLRLSSLTAIIKECTLWLPNKINYDLGCVMINGAAVDDPRDNDWCNGKNHA